MPFEFEDLSNKVAKGTADVTKQLDELVDSTKAVDKAFIKMTGTQRTSLEIADKFVKAMGISQKALTGIGKSSLVASRGLKDAGAASHSFSKSFVSDMATTSRSVAGVVK